MLPSSRGTRKESHMRGKALLILLLALVLGVAAACGGDDDESSDAAEPAAVAAEPADEGDASADDSADEEPAAEEDSGDDAAALDNIDAEQCAEALGAQSDLANVFSSGTPDSGDFEKAADALDEIAENAPDEIKDDFEVLAGFMREYVEVVGDIDVTSETPDPEDIQKLQEFAESIDQARLTEAGENIQAWAAENCPQG
jgi:hypothetical protein